MLYYRLKRNYSYAAVQYTKENEEKIICFGDGAVSFKQVFNTKIKGFEYRLILTKKDGQDILIPLKHYLVKSYYDEDFKIYSEEKFKETFVHIEQICEDDILDKEYCFCCGYYKNATCEFGNTLRKLKEKENILLQRNKEYAAIKKAEQDMYKNKEIYEKYINEPLLEDTEKKENFIKFCLKIIFIILIPLILALPTK